MGEWVNGEERRERREGGAPGCSKGRRVKLGREDRLPQVGLLRVSIVRSSWGEETFSR